MEKSTTEIKSLMVNPYKVVEKKIGFKIRSGREMTAIRHALRWAYGLDKDKQETMKDEWS